MKKYFYGIGKKLWVYTSLLLVISALLTISGIIFVITTSEKSRIREQYVSKTEYMYDMFDSAYENLDALTADLVTNEYIQKSLTEKRLSGYDYEMINRTLFYLNNEYIAHYYYFDNQNNLYAQRKSDLQKEDVKETQIAKAMDSSYAKTNLMYLDTSILGEEGERFVVGRYMHHLTQNREPGIVLLVLKESFFSDAVGKAMDEQSSFFIADGTGSICQGTAKEEQLEGLIEQKLTAYIKENTPQEDFVLEFPEGMLCGKWHEASGFYLVTFVPSGVLKQVQYKLVGIVLLVAVGAVFVTAWVAGYFSRHLSKPIREISTSMTNFNMDSLTAPLFIDTNTELDDISNAYNMMLEQIHDLLEKIRLQQEELRDTEIEALMYQIHPHFLYNTLGNIYMLARLNGEETMMRMIDSLSRFLRITLSNGEEHITVKEEIEHVCAYMEILRIRNDEMFRYEVECDEEVKELLILKLVLQPLAENAIKHGFAKCNEGGLIRICVKQEQQYLHVSIEDNGMGIAPDILERINRLEEEVTTEKRRETEHKKGIGIRNVVYRLKLKYADAVHFWYESKEGSTTGHITIETECLRGEHR